MAGNKLSARNGWKGLAGKGLWLGLSGMELKERTGRPKN